MELQNAPYSCNVPPLKQLNRCFTHHLLCKLRSIKLCNSLHTINWELPIYLELNKLNSANCWRSVEERCKMQWMCKCKLWCMKYLHNNDKQDLGFYSIFILDFTIWHRKCLENNIKSQYHILSTEQWVFPSPKAPEFGLLRRLQPLEVYYSCSTVTNLGRRGRAWYTQAHNTTEHNFKITSCFQTNIVSILY